MTNVLVTGAKGQLASCIKDIKQLYTNLNFIYTDYLELNICDSSQVNSFFETFNFDYCYIDLPQNFFNFFSGKSKFDKKLFRDFNCF